jgi:hypothetical protein
VVVLKDNQPSVDLFEGLSGLLSPVSFAAVGHEESWIWEHGSELVYLGCGFGASGCNNELGDRVDLDGSNDVV